VSALIRALRDAVGAAAVIDDPDVISGYCTDWTGRWTGTAVAAVRPCSVAETAAVLATVAEAGACLVPQGGNTGLVGAGVPRADLDRPQVLLSTERMVGLEPADPGSRTVLAGAGVALAQVQLQARAAGLRYGVDLGARDSATVGGTISTNAGGLRVVAYGDTRRQVAGLQAVLADGTVLDSLHGPLVDVSGYDLPGLLVGAEGTLGVITAARLRLLGPPPPSTVALLGVAGAAAAMELLDRVARAGELLAAEYLDRTTMEIVLDDTGWPPPLAHPSEGYLLLDVTGEPSLPDAAVVDPRVWRYRERAPEAITATGNRGVGQVHKMDVALPRDRVAEFAEGLRAVLDPRHRSFLYGHLGVGNLHVNVLGPERDDEMVDAAVLRWAAACGGSISAEHGVGIAKPAYLPLSRTSAEIAAMRRIKDALDPQHLLNPGVIFG
jgi:FAD/FMN-containing dehydrogenase